MNDRRTIISQANYVALDLLPAAAEQAKAGKPRLLAEIFHFLRPQPLIVHATTEKE